MAKKRRYYGRRGRRGRRGFKIPVVSLAILGGQIAVASQGFTNWRNVPNALAAYYTGVDIAGARFDAPSLLMGWGPWLVKGLVSKVARPMGASPKIPFGLPISLS